MKKAIVFVFMVNLFVQIAYCQQERTLAPPPVFTLPYVYDPALMSHLAKTVIHGSPFGQTFIAANDYYIDTLCFRVSEWSKSSVKGGAKTAVLNVYTWDHATQTVGTLLATNTATQTFDGTPVDFCTTFSSPAHVTAGNEYILVLDNDHGEYGMDANSSPGTGGGLLWTNSEVINLFAGTDEYAYTWGVIISGSLTGGGDPHMVGFNGESFDFMGVADEVFNLFTSPHLQVNALFYTPEDSFLAEEQGSSKPVTFMREIAVMQSNGNVVKMGIDYNPIYSPNQPLSSSSFKLNGNAMAYFYEPATLVLTLDECDINITRSTNSFERENADSFLDIKFNIKKAISQVHGVIGQTINVNRRKSPALPSGQQPYQGEGIIEGKWMDYMATDGSLTSTMFKYNLFNEGMENNELGNPVIMDYGNLNARVF